MTDAGRAAQERIRLQAVERFEGGEKNREIATTLRVSERSLAPPVARGRRGRSPVEGLAGATEARREADRQT